MEKFEVRKLWFRQNRVVELVIRKFWRISISKQSCRAGYTSILAYFCIKTELQSWLYVNFGLFLYQNRVVELVIRQFWLIYISKYSCRAGYMSILAYFCIKTELQSWLYVNFGVFLYQQQKLFNKTDYGIKIQVCEK